MSVFVVPLNERAHKKVDILIWNLLEEVLVNYLVYQLVVIYSVIFVSNLRVVMMDNLD